MGNENMPVRSVVHLLFLIFALAACSGGGRGAGGGGGGEEEPPPPPPPVPPRLSLLAGNIGGAGSVDGVGVAARFSDPRGLATDAAGNVFVADTGNHAIRKITPQGEVSVFAGKPGVEGSADGVGTAARFSKPTGLAVDAGGTVYVADTDNQTIRRISPAGEVSTLAGATGVVGTSDGPGPVARFLRPTGLAMDADGNICVADTFGHTIRKVTPAGVVSTFAGAGGSDGYADGVGSAARFAEPVGIASDAAGNLYVTESYNRVIRKIAPDGQVSTFAGSAGQVGSADGVGSAARFYLPTGIATDAAGNVYVVDAGELRNDFMLWFYHGNGTIRKVTQGGVVSTLAGLVGSYGSADGAGASARFFFNRALFTTPNGISVGAGGDIYVADNANNTVRKVTSGGTVTTWAGSVQELGAIDGEGASARFRRPFGPALDSQGAVYVADQLNHAIRKVSPSGSVSTIAGLAGASGAADGTGSGARLNSPAGVAVAANGDLYVADTYNHTLRKVTPGGTVTTIAGLAGVCGYADGVGSAAQFCMPHGVALDATGNIYVADRDGDSIRRVTPQGTVSTILGPGNGGGLSRPVGVAVDAAGTVYVADTGNHVVRRITAAGAATILAGMPGSAGYIEGTGMDARFDEPNGVAVDADGNLYVSDMTNRAIRRVSPAGAVTTIVGLPGVDGVRLGDLPASLAAPFGVAVAGRTLAITTVGAVLVVNLD